MKDKICDLCKKVLDDSNLLSVDCGGDCLECMAREGDPQAIEALIVFVKGVNCKGASDESRK